MTSNRSRFIYLRTGWQIIDLMWHQWDRCHLFVTSGWAREVLSRACQTNFNPVSIRRVNKIVPKLAYNMWNSTWAGIELTSTASQRKFNTTYRVTTGWEGSKLGLVFCTILPNLVGQWRTQPEIGWGLLRDVASKPDRTFTCSHKSKFGQNVRAIELS